MATSAVPLPTDGRAQVAGGQLLADSTSGPHAATQDGVAMRKAFRNLVGQPRAAGHVVEDGPAPTGVNARVFVAEIP